MSFSLHEAKEVELSFKFKYYLHAPQADRNFLILYAKQTNGKP